MRSRAAALLLVIVACNDGRQQRTAPNLYAEVRAALEHGEFQRARSLAHDGLRVSDGQPQWQELFAIADAEALGRIAPAEALNTLDRTPRSGSAEAAVRRLMAQGYALLAEGKNEEAETVYARADALAARAMPSLRAEIAMLRIAPPFHLEQWERAELLARDAIARGQRQRQLYVLANALGMLGSIEMNRQQWEQALRHLDEAARLARTIGAYSTLSSTTGNVGWCYRQLGDLDEAKARFQEAEAYAEANNVLRVQPTWLANIANVYMVREQYGEALPFAQRSVAAARKLDDRRKLATSLSNLAQIEIALGRTDAATRTNDESLALRRRIGDQKNELWSLLNSARIEAARRFPDRALATLDMVIQRADQPPLRWQAQAIAASIHRSLGRTNEAERMYEAALDTGDSARVKVSDDAYLFAFESNLIHFYDDYIDLLINSGRAIDALRVAERSRARTLREGIGLLPRGASDQAAFSPVATARKTNALILSYWLAPRRSLLWSVSERGVSVATLRPAAVIEHEIRLYRDELLDGRRALESDRGARLYDMLVAPAMPATASRRVIVIPDGTMNGINLETLIVASPRPHYWIEDVTLSYAPSLHLIESPGSRGVRDGDLLLIGNVPAAGREFPALSRAGLEIDDVARHFDQRRRVVLAGGAATPAAYLASKPQQFDYLHFVAHGTANTRAPLDSAVILASDGNGFRLTGRDIVRAPLDAQLVTVSSCHSAGQRSYAGEGLVGLAWAFLRAGARRVVAAQWEVSDTATPILMDRMYAGLAAGRDPATALRDAKLTLLHSDSIYSRPLYWAPFVVYGAA